jgi:hypothetical protein
MRSFLRPSTLIGTRFAKALGAEGADGNHQLPSGKTVGQQIANTLGWLNHEGYTFAAGGHPSEQVILTEKGLAALNAVPKGLSVTVGILACECNDSCAKLVERGRSRWRRDRRLHKEYVGLMRQSAGPKPRAPVLSPPSAFWRLLCHGCNSQKVSLRRTAILTPQQPEYASRSGAVCGRPYASFARPGLPGTPGPCLPMRIKTPRASCLLVAAIVAAHDVMALET